ncbi:hypothetical protein IKO70_03105 [bacterium]|nr:hypothetical protein [bacterium]
MRNFFDNISATIAKIPQWGLIFPILVLMLFHHFVVFDRNKNEEKYKLSAAPTETEMKVFQIINTLPHNSKVLILVNYGPESKYELESAMSALIGVLAEKNIGIAFATMIPNGVESAFTAVEKSIENGSFGKERFVYGHEYTHLGFIVGGNIATYLIANNFDQVKERDIFDSSTDIHQPLMSEIGTISDFSAVFEFSSQTFDGVPGIVSFAVMQKDKNVKKVAFCSSDMLSAYIPFRESLYLDGLIGGFKSIAVFIHEFQPSLNIEKQYNIMSTILFYIIWLVIFSNLIKLTRKNKK